MEGVWVTANPSITYSPPSGSVFAMGTHTVTATATDGAGNVSGASASFALTVDATAPATPAITAVTDDAAPLTGNIAPDGSAAYTITSTFDLDLAGDVLSTTQPGGAIENFSYDARGLEMTSTSEGETTTHDYDGLGRETHTVEPGPDGR